ncbi:hypothetical protein M413DRAFT_29938 [Hebeloma cylindrosporum]|uniref:Uncharacterized protein n=1 Tax=Hebeloma cylindrosporum TaxID=76867 RepID=A0A0C3C543_HEBCY|nr:hypothetical protein M413DRAFT_29938 [Hebeloma cylindrosporum h7]
MGTPGLLGFFIRGQRRSTYNRWDSYPDGLARDIVDFILSLAPEDYSTMARLIAELTWVDSDSKPSSELRERYQKLGFADTSSRSGRLEDWYYLLCNIQGAPALPAIQSGNLKHMRESPLGTTDWAWAYFIDFENRMLEAWVCGTILDIIPFEKLVKDGVERYVRSLERYERVVFERESDSEQEEEGDETI